ncbi:hypothetical protein DICVIV_04026 [Dictyocaulus viviparus]|uniref:Uncharacterized protein n=1 Tax=Dictyocaulus viviparus TaxID=29172 RepID=A0A0D8Y120_DICVI|nr:hypothetical protein DICVIV_04026 [Dictyocaulus viviparus]
MRIDCLNTTRSCSSKLSILKVTTSTMMFERHISGHSLERYCTR